MSGPIGHTFLYNIIILFVVIVFAFLVGSLSYYKSFRVNNNIVSSLEQYEGYNKFSRSEIERNLSNLGYSVKSLDCKSKYRGMSLVSSKQNYSYCVYISEDNPKQGTYFNYGVLTYMSLDLPIVNIIKFPVFTRTNRIYKFTNAKSL